MPLQNTVNDTQQRRITLLDIINQFRAKGKLINRYTLQPALKEKGFDVSFATIYRDMTSINQKNTWVRDLSESNYSAYQEQISNNLDWIETQAAQQFKETENHVWLNIIHRVQETKMKHTNGENINISVALLGNKFKELSSKNKEKKEEKLLEERVDVVKLATELNNVLKSQ